MDRREFGLATAAAAAGAALPGVAAGAGSRQNDHSGQRLRQARLAEGKAVAECADAIGVSAEQWHEYERSGLADCDVMTGVNAANLLGVCPYWLAFGKPRAALAA